MGKNSFCISVGLLVFVFSCSQQNSSNNEGKMEVSIQIDTLTSKPPVHLDSVAPSSGLKSKIELVSPLFISWGFQREKSMTLTEKADFDKHWLLKIFKRYKVDEAKYHPTSKDWSSLKSIHQETFKKNWRYVIEEWQLTDTHAARKWLKIALNSTKLDDAKPPRLPWIEGNKMYIVMATAARDWFEHSDELIEKLTSNNRALVELFNKPLDLVDYKKKKRGSNSSPWTKRAYYYQPDSIGTYFNYFYFQQLMPRYSTEDLFEGLVVKTYIYGREIGNYENVSEELIGIKSKLEDLDLGSLNIVGLAQDDLLDRFNISPSENYIVKEHNGDLLIIHFENGKVNWFNYLRSNLDLSNDPLPEELKYFEEVIPK